MSDIFTGKTKDSIKYKKDCPDFVVLKDGTSSGDYHYCDLSLNCRQIDVSITGHTMSMESNYLPIYNANNELVGEELFCTGMCDARSLNERLSGDNKVS